MMQILKIALLLVVTMSAAHAEDLVEVGSKGVTCIEDTGCINRIHPNIPMIATARPGQTILFRTRDASDILGTVDSQTDQMNESGDDWHFGRVHPLTGPVHIEGAKAGDEGHRPAPGA